MKANRKPGERKCSRCKRYSTDTVKGKAGALLCQSCAKELKDLAERIPSPMAGIATAMTAALLAKKPRIEVSGEPKLDLSDE